jgi:hypothetical protein
MGTEAWMAKKVATEKVKVKDLAVGDILVDETSEGGKNRTGVVTKISILPVEQRPAYYKKTATRLVLMTDKRGQTYMLGYDGKVSPTCWVNRQCDAQTAATQELQEEILDYRIGVRTVLSRCETDLVRWSESVKYRKPSAKLKSLLEVFRLEYTKIFEQLEALDASMTEAAGKNDSRKPVHPHGRRRN